MKGEKHCDKLTLMQHTLDLRGLRGTFLSLGGNFDLISGRYGKKRSEKRPWSTSKLRDICTIGPQI